MAASSIRRSRSRASWSVISENSDILAADCFAHGVRNLLRGGLAAHVRRQNTVSADLFHRAHQAIGCIRFAQVVKHLARGPESGNRIGDPLAGDVEGRTV